MRWLGVIVALAARLACAQPAPGDRLDAFTLAAFGGGEATWKTGRPSVICFCAFWCDTWKEQSRRLSAAKGALRGTQVDFVTVSIDGRWSELAGGKTVGQLLLDEGGALSRKLEIAHIPFTVVVDASGVVRFARQGVVRSADVERAVRDALSGLPKCGTVYLTFDDFPARDAPGLDDELLDVLRGAGVKATFFAIGSHIEGAAEVVRRATREGHSLQLHSWSHDATSPELARCAEALLRVAGESVRPTLYRVPGSSKLFRLDALYNTTSELSLPCVNPYDFARPEQSELLRRVLAAVKPGSVILLHSGVRETLDVLPELIRSVRSRGLRFGALTDPRK